MYFLPFIWRISALHGSFSVLVTWQTWSVFAFLCRKWKGTHISHLHKYEWEVLGVFSFVQEPKPISNPVLLRENPHVIAIRLDALISLYWGWRRRLAVLQPVCGLHVGVLSCCSSPLQDFLWPICKMQCVIFGEPDIPENFSCVHQDHSVSLRKWNLSYYCLKGWVEWVSSSDGIHDSLNPLCEETHQRIRSSPPAH